MENSSLLLGVVWCLPGTSRPSLARQAAYFAVTVSQLEADSRFLLSASPSPPLRQAVDHVRTVTGHEHAWLLKQILSQAASAQRTGSLRSRVEVPRPPSYSRTASQISFQRTSVPFLVCSFSGLCFRFERLFPRIQIHIAFVVYSSVLSFIMLISMSTRCQHLYIRDGPLSHMHVGEFRFKKKKTSNSEDVIPKQSGNPFFLFFFHFSPFVTCPDSITLYSFGRYLLSPYFVLCSKGTYSNFSGLGVILKCCTLKGFPTYNKFDESICPQSFNGQGDC